MIDLFPIVKGVTIPPVNTRLREYSKARTEEESTLHTALLRAGINDRCKHLTYPFHLLEIGDVMYTPRAMHKRMKHALANYRNYHQDEHFVLRGGYPFSGVWRVATKKVRVYRWPNDDTLPNTTE